MRTAYSTLKKVAVGFTKRSKYIAFVAQCFAPFSTPILNQSAIFVGSVVSFLNVFKYTPPKPPPCRLDIIFDLKLAV
jgi:hypothetical protein